MKKKYLLLSIPVIFIVLIFGIIIYINKTISVSEIKDFKEVFYNDNFEDLQILALDLQTDKTYPITNIDDIKNILTPIKNSSAKLMIPKDPTLGFAYRMTIVNKTTGKEVYIIISNYELAINHVYYILDHNLLEEIKDVYSKYLP